MAAWGQAARDGLASGHTGLGVLAVPAEADQGATAIVKPLRLIASYGSRASSGLCAAINRHAVPRNALFLLSRETAGERENQLLSLWHRPYHPEAYRQSQAGR